MCKVCDFSPTFSHLWGLDIGRNQWLNHSLSLAYEHYDEHCEQDMWSEPPLICKLVHHQ